MTGFMYMTANPENVKTDQKNLLPSSCNALSTLHLIPCVGGALTKQIFFLGKVSPLCFQYLRDCI